MAPKCPVCLALYFEDKEPITIPCGHTLCKLCIAEIVRIKVHFKCPECNKIYSEQESKSLLRLQPNIHIKGVMANLKTRCWLHSALAERVCITHVQALCENCDAHRGCKVYEISEDFESIQRDLDKMLRKLKKQNTLPHELNHDIDRALRKSLHDLLKLYKSVHTAINGPDHSDPREALLSEGLKDLRKVHSCLLPKDLLSRWKSPPDSEPEVQQLISQIHKFVGMPVESEDSLPDQVCCMQCLK